MHEYIDARNDDLVKIQDSKDSAKTDSFLPPSTDLLPSLKVSKEISMRKTSCNITSFDDWFSEYCPTLNPIEEDADFDGTKFATSGAQLRQVRLADDSCVWTLVDEGGRRIIVSGYSQRNRIGHFITEDPWHDDMIIEIA